jgi:TolB protein
MKNDGTAVLRLTNDSSMDVWPVYSPDGKAIAFTSNRTGSYNVFVMNEDGSGVRNITNNKSINNFAAWSPDGKSIAFISNHQGSYEVYFKSFLRGNAP